MGNLLKTLIAVISIVPAIVSAAPRPDGVYPAKPLPRAWSQELDNQARSLFRRAPSDGTNYAPVGTPEWSAGFPPPGAIPDVKSIPQAWLAALDAAVANGKIPDIPSSNPYPTGVDPNSPQVCSSAAQCRIPGDIWDGPDGVFASSFDDGPSSSTTQLVQFLKTNNVTTTHFMIGSNILRFPSQFLEAFNAGGDIAVHTWSHPRMTTLSNAAIVGELGWTMQLIHNSTGGRVPRYWRPPYQDSDMRVRAIAKEVFGLETVIWNTDTSDYQLGDQQQIVDKLAEFLARPKSPGLITLEHEIKDVEVGGFINAFPLIASNGWKFRSLAEVMDGRAYQNANSSTSDVSKKGILLAPTSTS